MGKKPKKNGAPALAGAIALVLIAATWPTRAWAEPPEPPRHDDREKGPPRKDRQKYSIEQAISDRAQLHTIAFSGLAFITGDFGASTFIPPGKVCDFFGFQYMRDIDIAGKGHNPMFLNRAVGNVLHILNEEQKRLFRDLAGEQAGQLEALARLRLPLIKAFREELDGNIPKGGEGLDKDAVVQYVGKIFAFDAELSYRRAEVFGKVAASLTPEQKARFGKMKFGDFNSWAPLDERDRGRPPKGDNKSKLFNVAYMTYAGEFFSWYAGSLKADIYFCPERHGTYFGGFYMKDMPAMGKRDYDIGVSITGDKGEMFLDALDAKQRANIEDIIDVQRKTLTEIIKTREKIATELRKFLQGETPDKAKALELGRHYGELDGALSWRYAVAFAKINRSLTAEQRQALGELRNLDGYKSAPYYIYSRAMKDDPALPSADSFFFKPQKGKTP